MNQTSSRFVACVRNLVGIGVWFRIRSNDAQDPDWCHVCDCVMCAAAEVHAHNREKASAHTKRASLVAAPFAIHFEAR
jgi:hypothetical protein